MNEDIRAHLRVIFWPLVLVAASIQLRGPGKRLRIGEHRKAGEAGPGGCGPILRLGGEDFIDPGGGVAVEFDPFPVFAPVTADLRHVRTADVVPTAKPT